MTKLAVLILVGTSFVCRDAALANPLLVFTENSSTDLKVTLNGADYGTVAGAPDQWFLTPPDKPGATVVFISGGGSWVEPENHSLINWIAGGSLGGGQVGIGSDDVPVPADRLATAVTDGSIIPDALTVLYSDLSQSVFDVQFIDKADIESPAGVPDHSSTLHLALISCFGFALSGRVCSQFRKLT